MATTTKTILRVLGVQAATCPSCGDPMAGHLIACQSCVRETDNLTPGRYRSYSGGWWRLRPIDVTAWTAARDERTAELPAGAYLVLVDDDGSRQVLRVAEQPCSYNTIEGSPCSGHPSVLGVVEAAGELPAGWSWSTSSQTRAHLNNLDAWPNLATDELEN